ncbi:MAG: sialate O-acetylesterase [Pedobacter sp.]|nr:MAG: sialate O-acetylesterase [Pedobacter sp.]
MVLQRNEPVKIWGFAAAGEQVTVSFSGQTKSTVTNSSGKWEVILASLKTAAVGQDMLIKGSNTIKLTDILVGEVWLCSGQSNMEYQMRKLVKIPVPKNPTLGFPKNEVENADNKNIRIFLVNRKTLAKPDSLHKSWSLAEDSALRAFSVVGYFFAKEVQTKLGIPIGIISSAVSGSAIEPWIAEEAFANEPYFSDKKVGNDPGKFYTSMIEPLKDFKLRGFLWYQGETNCFLDEKISYAYKMKTLINLWRNAWANSDMPFYLVQIAPYNYSKAKGEKVLNENTQPEFWEAQAQQLRLANTGLVITTDLNDNGEDLHPTYKWEVGRRLALWALNNTYKHKSTFSGPIFKSANFTKDKTVVTFDHADAGLKSIDGKPLTGFSVAGKDGKYVAADAVIVGKKVVVSAPAVKEPTAVRFNWTEAPTSNFYGATGLPAMPFRSDNPLNKEFNIN